LLISILMPSLNKARMQAKNAVCLSNLHQIGLASSAYAAESKNGLFPDWWTVGGAGFRVMPGMVTDYPGSKQETYGLPALYQTRGLLSGRSPVWTCPLNLADAKNGNTYWWNTSDTDTQSLSNYYSSKHSLNKEIVDKTGVMWVWDNYSVTPYLSGQRRPRENVQPGEAGDRGAIVNGKYQGINTGYFRTVTVYHRGQTSRNVSPRRYGLGTNGIHLDLSAGFVVVKAE
jgi:hypothetical protein